MKSYGYEIKTLLEFVAVVLRDHFLEISSKNVLAQFKQVLLALLSPVSVIDSVFRSLFLFSSILLSGEMTSFCGS